MSNDSRITQRLIDLAAKNANGSDSAALCLSDAKACAARGDHQHSRSRALASMRHSVGIFHADYRAALAALPPPRV